MFDNKVHDFKISLEKELEKLDYNWKWKEFSEILAKYFKNKFLDDKSFNIRLHYKDFNNYNIYKSNILNEENCNNLLGYNRAFNGNGDIVEFFGFFIDIIDKFTEFNYANICSIYIIMYYNKDKNTVSYYIPEKGNTVKLKNIENEKIKLGLVEKDVNAYLDFFEIKKELFRFFFHNNKNKYNEDLTELFYVIKIFSNDKNINNLIDNFNKKYLKNKNKLFNNV